MCRHSYSERQLLDTSPLKPDSRCLSSLEGRRLTVFRQSSSSRAGTATEKMRPSLVFMLLFGLAISYDNEYHEALHKVCPYGSSFVRVTTVYSSSQKDRRYKFLCGQHAVSSHNCYWGVYINKIGSYANGHCKSNYVMTGVFGHYNFSKQDRRFKIKCCQLATSKTKFCEWTPFSRCSKSYQDYILAKDRVLRGLAFPYYSNGDRQLQPYICRI